MIQSVEINNFKSIKSKYFPLRNLNILLGMNGQGKSSFIQFLLLLRQSKQNIGYLKLNEERGLINIGTSKDALYQYGGENDFLHFSLNFKNSEIESISMEYDYEVGSDFFVTRNKEISKNLNLKDGALFSDNKFQYLHSQRIEPKATNITSLYSVKNHNDLGKYGQYTAHYIELRGSEAIAFDNVLHPDSYNYDVVREKEVIDKTLINQINLWLGEISPDINVKTTQVNSDLILLSYAFKQPNLGFTNDFKPENVGFGISYALHVVTALLKAKQGDLVIIENPESHIHPRGQAELGKLIALVAQNDVQVIIETHSDHIVNGIRVGIKENPKLKDRTILFYFEKEITEKEQYSKITNIEIDSKGELSEYPKGLLEEWSNQMLKLL